MTSNLAFDASFSGIIIYGIIIYGKIDEVKEILNTLRVAMSIGFGVFVLIFGKLVSFYTEENFSEIFWITTIASILNIIVIFLIVRKIALKTKEIKDL